MLLRTLAALVFAALAASPGAQAATIAFAYQGVVTSVDNPDGLIDDSIVVGTPFSGIFVYESELEDTWSETNQGRYRSNDLPNEASLSIGSYSMRFPGIIVRILDDLGAVGADRIQLSRGGSSTSFLESGPPIESSVWGPVSIGVEWDLEPCNEVLCQVANGYTNPLNSDALPLTAPDLSLWLKNQLTFGGFAGAICEFVDCSETFDVVGVVTSVELVPEPRLAAYGATFAFGLALRVRCRDLATRRRTERAA